MKPHAALRRGNRRRNPNEERAGKKQLNIKMTSAQRLLAACLLGIVSGFILITLPGVLHREHTESIFALVDSSVKNLSASHLLLLLAAGFFWGLVLKWPYSLFAAICQVGSLPVFAVIEMLRDSTSHNLWPLEFLIYAALALIPLLGMGTALLVKRLFKRYFQQGRGPKASAA
jgi:phosphate/sulfate permease